MTAIAKIESFDETDTREMGNLCGTGGTLFFSKQHPRGPPSVNHVKLDRKQNVHIVAGSPFTR